MSKVIPQPSIERLCRIFGFLEKAGELGIKTVFSGDIADNLGVFAHTVRKDISYCGEIGNTAAGYDAAKLKVHIYRHLHLDRKQSACIAGLGMLGKALLNHDQFIKSDYRIIAGFDSDINTIEMIQTPVKLYPSYRITEIVRELGITLAIIAVPANAAQGVANKLIEGGVRGIINFTQGTVQTQVPEVIIRNIDLYAELRILSALLQQPEIPSDDAAE